MFSTSTHRRNWLFPSEKALADVRQEANRFYIEEGSDAEAPGHHVAPRPQLDPNVVLNPDEENEIRLYYEIRLIQFCRDFRFQKSDISIPLFVQYTAMAYFKRFYLCSSVMDYHPADIYLVCIYVACKTEEFNIAMPDFEENISRHFEFDPESPDDCAAVTDLSKMVLCFELILMAKLDYDLIVHAPLKPLEGFLLDIRTRFPEFAEADNFKTAALRFITVSMFSDVPLMFAPSQIALAALTFATGPGNDKVSRYIKEVLCLGASEEDFTTLVTAVNDVMKTVSSSRAEWAMSFVEDTETSAAIDSTISTWIEGTIDKLLERLKNCRNPANDYLTEQFSKRFNDTMFSDDD